MLKLKQVLAHIEQPQAALAKALELSPSAIAQLVNHGQWPRRLELEGFKLRIQLWLRSHGASNDAAASVFEEVEPARANAKAPASPDENNHVNDQECEPMLLRKQVLLPETKRAFGLLRDPFEDLQSAEDMYVSPDIRYIREAMYQTARHDGFLAIVGESGAGKSTLRRDLISRLTSEGAPVVVVEPYVLAMEDNDSKGKTLKSTHIAEAIMAAVAPLEKTMSSPEARFRQLHRALKTSHESGYRHCLIIEEAHSLPIPTLKQLKRLRELEVGFTKLVSVILVGQPELQVKLSERNGEVREVVQRIEIAELLPIGAGRLDEFLAFRLGRIGKRLDEVIDTGGVQALVSRLTSSSRDGSRSHLYPLAVGNLLLAALNLAGRVGESLVTDEIVREV